MNRRQVVSALTALISFALAAFFFYERFWLACVLAAIASATFVYGIRHFSSRRY